MTEKINGETQNRHRQLSINRKPATRSVVMSKKKTLLIGDFILNRINTKGIEKGVQNHSTS